MALQGLTFTWWDVAVYAFWHKPTEPAHSFLVCSCLYFCLYGPFNCTAFHKFSRQLSAFSLCCSGLISACLALSTMYLFMKVSLSSDFVLCGWLGLKHQLTNRLTNDYYLNIYCLKAFCVCQGPVWILEFFFLTLPPGCNQMGAP